jgi:peptidoglycan/LPS O-acetylase OafA/YrhL
LISLPIVLGIAWLSWNLIERPILSRKKPILGAVDLVWTAVISKLGFFVRRRESACLERQDERAERARAEKPFAPPGIRQVS